jgi:iron complex outermembrane receptor protein
MENKMKKSLLLSFGSVCAFVVAFSAAAHAQSVDYGSLESMMGQPVTTSASGTPQTQSDVAANMTIVSADEIRQSGSRNIPQILSRVAGLEVLQEGVDSFDVGVRGYQQPYQPRLLVLIDGRQVFIDDYSRTAWNNLPVNVDNIRQIEVVKGASSALFGSNATGGVVNIITYSPIYDKTNVASITVGTQDTVTGDATVTSHLGGLGGVSISAGGLTQSEFTTPRRSTDNPNATVAPKHRYLAESSVFQVTPHFQANSEITFSDGDNNYGIYSYSIYPLSQSTYSLRAGFDWQTPYGLIKSNNYFNHEDSAIDPGTALGVLKSGVNLFVSQLEDQFKLGTDHTFRAGIEYRHKQLTGKNFPTAIAESPDFNEDVFAASGTWLWNITDKLTATNAVRVDANHMEQDGQIETTAQGSVFTPAAYNQDYATLAVNSGLVYKPTNMDTIRATYGRGVQNPSLIESGFNLNLTSLPVDIQGNPNLKPTIVQNYELSYDRKVPEIFSTASVSAYYELNQNLKALRPGVNLTSTFELLSQAINVGNSSGLGYEIELKGHHPSGFRWDGSYSFQEVRDAALVAQTLGNAKSAPQHHFRALVGYTNGPWEFDTNAQYVTSSAMLRSVASSVTSQVQTEGYFTVAARVGYKVTDNASIALTGFNVTQDTTATSAYPQVQRQVLLTLTDHF